MNFRRDAMLLSFWRFVPITGKYRNMLLAADGPQTQGLGKVHIGRKLSRTLYASDTQQIAVWVQATSVVCVPRQI